MSALHSMEKKLTSTEVAVLNQPAGKQWTNWLRWRQWLVLLAMGALAIIVELSNHIHIWDEYQSGQSVSLHPDLLMEILLFGFILPVLAGLTLDHFGRTAREKDKMIKNQEVRRALVGQMQETQDWDELVELVVASPGLVTTASRSWLLAARSSEQEFEEIAHWEHQDGRLLSPAMPVSPAICENCVGLKSLNGSRILSCTQSGSGSSDHLDTRYCLWLSPVGTRKATLLFDLPPKHVLEPAQVKLLDDLGVQMSMAIDNANLRFQEQHHIDLAKNERLRIARDLHDTLGQNISYLRLKLNQLADDPPASDRAELQNDLTKMLAVADEAYEQVRNTLEELRTSEQPDLEESVRLYASRSGTRGGFAVCVHSSGQIGTLSARQSRQLMYIVREALNNVEKHAGAQNVDIYLQWGNNKLDLLVRDDGRGLNPEELKSAKGYGMAIMEERSRAIKANLTLQSVPGEGTELILSLPLTRNGSSTPVNL